MFEVDNQPPPLEPYNLFTSDVCLREAVKREQAGWAEDGLATLGATLGKPETVLTMYRQTGHVRSRRHVDPHALTAWTARVVGRAQEVTTPVAYRPNSITPDVMREIAKLSWSDQGPRLAQEFLAKRLGIPMIVEQHLPGTHLDGAAIQGPELLSEVVD